MYMLVSDDVQILITDYKRHQSEHLDGILTTPTEQEDREIPRRRGIVVFAHGSGSGRHSPRNQYVASLLNNQSRIATLLVDLLTKEEQEIDEKTREYRFNIKLLADRLSAITDWLLLSKNHDTHNIAIGYFGASTGAAAALVAAAASVVEHSTTATTTKVVVKAIVSRGGRPDLARSSYLKKVEAATLLLVGSNDNSEVIALNQKALQQLKSAKEKRLIMVSGAGHLFEEPGTLEEAAKHTASWFERYL
jgi:putative phosphoribosyl transferase